MNVPLKLPTGTTGALNELAVCADLMRRGYHVYRSMSQACPCDLVIWKKHGDIMKVEVKTGRYGLRGQLQFSVSESQRNACDVIAVVTSDSLIRYLAASTRSGLEQPPLIDL